MSNTLQHLRELAERLRTQDNRITSDPIFIVQEKQRVYWFDTNYSDRSNTVWINEEGNELDAEDYATAERNYESGDVDKNPDTWTRTAFQDHWEFVTACFTEQGCKDYLAINGHNLKEPRIYVESGYRNNEWQFLRELLSGSLVAYIDQLETREKKLLRLLGDGADIMEELQTDFYKESPHHRISGNWCGEGEWIPEARTALAQLTPMEDKPK